VAFTFIISMVVILLVAAGVAAVVWAGLREPRTPVTGSGLTAVAARTGRILNGDEHAADILQLVKVPVRTGRPQSTDPRTH